MFLVWTFLPQRPAPVVGAFEQHLVKSRYRPTIRASKAETPRVWRAREGRGGGFDSALPCCHSEHKRHNDHDSGRVGGLDRIGPLLSFQSRKPPPPPQEEEFVAQATRLDTFFVANPQNHSPPPAASELTSFFFFEKNK